MNQKKKDLTLCILGILSAIVLLYIMFIIRVFSWYTAFFWVCYIGVLTITIGIFLKNPVILLSQMYILLIPDLIWAYEFFYRIFTKSTLLGIHSNFFIGENILTKILVIQHISTPILAIGALALFKQEKLKKSCLPLLISFFELIILFCFGFILPKEAGVNCLPNSSSCFSAILPAWLPYSLVWLGTWSFFILCSYLLLKIFFKNKF